MNMRKKNQNLIKRNQKNLKKKKKKEKNIIIYVKKIKQKMQNYQKREMNQFQKQKIYF